MKIEFYTDKGKRSINEDYVFSKEINKNSLLSIVADGMGGYSKGEVASKMAVEQIFDYLKKYEGQSAKETIANSIHSANEVLKEYRLENNIKLGTTIGGIYVSNNHAILFWIGDVRIFFFRNNNLIFESQDHSLINELKKDKALPDDWDVNRIKHVVTRSISGNDQDFNPDFYEIDIEPNDVIIICSDGFLESFEISYIKKIASEQVLNEDEINNRCKSSSDNASILKIQF